MFNSSCRVPGLISLADRLGREGRGERVYATERGEKRRKERGRRREGR
jgi:hypothetical protein